MDSRHISIERAIAFLLHDGELEPFEEEHLLRCDDCRRLAVEAAITELRRPPDDAGGQTSES